MATRTDKTDSFRKPNEDKFNFDEYDRNMDRNNQFAPIDDRGSGAGLRSFVEQELNRRAINSSGSSETLGKGIYLRLTPNDEFELTVFRGRGFFDCYICQTREEALALGEELQNQKGR